MTPASAVGFLRGSWLAGLAALMLAVAAGAAEPAPEWRLSPRQTRDAVRATVEAQLAAFRAGDLAKAYAFAAAGIRRQFSEAVFAAMIRRGYPALLRQASAEVGLVRDDRGDRAKVEVTVTDRLGHRTSYLYFLVREQGAWMVEGVVGDERPKQGDV